MKIRTGFVSNSSSSSFIIAYDPNFFGDLQDLFEEYDWGCETAVQEDLEKFISNYLDTEEEIPAFKKKVEVARAEGKKILAMRLDREYRGVMALLEMINEQNNQDKLVVLYDTQD